MTQYIHTWWPREPLPGNFGDILTPYLVKKITGKTPKYVNKTFNVAPINLLAVGSVIKFANKNTVVWGSGAMQMSDCLSPNADYRAVRGPLTRELVLKSGADCPEVYGDPALLLPCYYRPTTEKEYRIGIIPHYVDYDFVVSMYGNDPDVKIVNLINANIENVIDEIAECENVISSSLHGIIAAHAYGINAKWVKFSNKLIGDGTKFRDYFASVGVEMKCMEFSTKLEYSELKALDYTGLYAFDYQPLLAAFPHDKLD